MSQHCTRAVLGAVLLVTGGIAHADFQNALKQYNAGHFDIAHAQFMTLAELGDCSAQFNLGAMALQGQGGAKDPGSGVGWLQAAAGNGCEQLVGNKVAGLQANLSADEQRAAAGIVARYGRDALHNQGIVNPEFSCRDTSPASANVSATPEIPRVHAGLLEGAVVITELTVGVDGHARDPQVLLALPERGYAEPAIVALLNSSFTPAQRAGRPIESRLQLKQVFTRYSVHTLAELDTYKNARTRADAGDAEARYLLGLTATLDASLGISPGRADELLLVSARDGEPRAQYWVGSQLHASSACHPQSSGAVWLRHAAANGSGAAELTLARDMLASQPSAAQLSEARALLQRASGSPDYYVMEHVAALLAAAPQEGLRDPATAITVARRLAGGEIQSDPQMFETIAAAYAAVGEFNRAVREQHTAIRKAQSLGWDTRAMGQRLAAYKSGQSWYGDLFAQS